MRTGRKKTISVLLLSWLVWGFLAADILLFEKFGFHSFPYGFHIVLGGEHDPVGHGTSADQQLETVPLFFKPMIGDSLDEAFIGDMSYGFCTCIRSRD